MPLSPEKRILALWSMFAAVAICLTFLLCYASHSFSYSYRVIEMPIIEIVSALAASGILFLLLLPLIKYTLQHKPDLKTIMLVIFAAGVVMRLLLFFSEPILEDDYQRYFLDGAMTAHGQNPYKYSPSEIKEAAKENQVLQKIVTEAGVVLERINHPELRTIYPPATQGLFAFAYFIKPFDLTAWRTVLLVFDCISFFLICQLCRLINRPVVWVSLYWWNPVILKELFNSAHMEAVLIPFLLLGILMALREKYAFSNVFIVLAAAVKIWPLALLAITLRPILYSPRKLIVALLPALVIGTLLAMPVLLATLDQNSGFVAYATRWKTNSGLFPILMFISESFISLVNASYISPNLMARGIIVTLMLVIIFSLYFNPIASDEDLLRRCFLLVSGIFLLSPAQFPWYLAWIAAFLPLFPVKGFLVLTITLPFYYIAFHLMARSKLELFNELIVWFIWLPVWGILAFELYIHVVRNRTSKSTSFTHAGS